MAIKYEQVVDDTPFMEPKDRRFRLACCDCGLVHWVTIRDVEGSPDAVELTVSRNEPATRALRASDKTLRCKP